MSTYQLCFSLLGLALILFLVWILRTQHKNKIACIAHVFATFYTSTGAKYDALCATDDKVVEAPSRARKATKDKIKDYFVSEDKTFLGLYPPGKPSWLQVSVPTTAYYEGSPDPIVSRDPKKRMIPVGTPAVLHNIRDEKMTSLMVRVSEEMDKFRRAAQAILNPKLIYLLLVVAIIVGIVNAFMLMESATQVNRLAQLWGL